ncbi:hypothetical protein CC78DRAFT_574721 [Lojkania enalia]|uniref:Conidiation-specific expression protein n=1 Tax=Lojkania enalia TaxID=147567 RepID=A0A9P4NAZ8_9PLEO|nr:hypothetical protein CC78DRAFT_574721 [Didymosphaeria enalia]
MPSPFHQKYATQSHRVFGQDTTTAMPEAPKQDSMRRSSEASVGSSNESPTERRRSSATNRFAALEALKRPTDEASTARRSSLQDSYGKTGIIGTMWNNFTRGPSGSPPKQKEPPRDTTTLRE